MTSNLLLFLLILTFEGHFRIFMLFLSKYSSRKRNRKKKKVSKSDFATLSLVIVSWLLLQSFDRFFLIESYLCSSFCFNISLQFLLATILKGFCLIAQEGFGFLILKMPVNFALYRVTVGIFNNRQIIISLHYEASLYSGMSNNLFNYGSGYSS